MAKCFVCEREFTRLRHNVGKNGRPICSRACQNILMTVPDGTIKKRPRGSGYHVMQKSANHPAADRTGYVYQHRLIMENEIGRHLTSKERVHHINLTKSENSIQNLLLCRSDREHFKIHGSLNACVSELMEMGALGFDRDTKRYFVISSHSKDAAN